MTRIGLIQAASGVSGDMFLGALVGAGVPLEVLEAAVRAVGGERLGLATREVRRGGLAATKVDVLVDGAVLHETGGPVVEGVEDPVEGAAGGDPHEHLHDSHRSPGEIDAQLVAAPLEDAVRRRAREVFRRLAEAEGRCHGVAPEAVHFHEVGAADAIADVLGTVAGVHHLGLDRLYHGPVAVGGGTLRAAHGVLPVPAPATLDLLRGRSVRQEEGLGELTTPTGAALLTTLAEAAPRELAWTPETEGYGAGSKDPPGRPNVLRLTLGRVSDAGPGARRLAVLEAALDDATPEEGGHWIRFFLDAGALDVTLTPLVMKKARPGFLLRLLCPEEDRDAFAERLLIETSTLGVRWRIEERRELERRFDRVRVAEGEVRVKVALLPDGRERPRVEFEDLRRVAEARGEPLERVRREIEGLWERGR